jgi:hypothetical protein
MPTSMRHFTTLAGYNAIRANPIWKFLAGKPPGDHPRGAYFTTLAPDAPGLAARLGIPKTKLEYLFQFTDAGDLTALRGGRGRYVFYSAEDYLVGDDRQEMHGPRE